MLHRAQSFLALVAVSSACTIAAADAVFDTGQPNTIFGPIGYDISTGQSVAVAFVPDQSYTLDRIGLWIMSNDFENPGRTYQLSLRADASSGGGTSEPAAGAIEMWSVATAAVGWDAVRDTVDSALHPLLTAGTTYWVVAESSEPPSFDPVWVWADTTDEVTLGIVDFVSGPAWQVGPVIGSAPGVLVEGTLVPEPAAIALLALGGALLARRRG